MISITGLGRSYGSIVALRPLTLELPKGKTIGLLGANGAGKTTTLNLLTTLLEPSEGTAVVAGCDIRRDPLGVRRAIGYLPEHASAYDGLTADEYLELAGRARTSTRHVLEGHARQGAAGGDALARSASAHPRRAHEPRIGTSNGPPFSDVNATRPPGSSVPLPRAGRNSPTRARP